MNFAIRYLTEYRYDAEVTDNLNALRVKPATTPTQRVEDFVVRVDPEARLHQHSDYFGTTVIEFGISRPHGHLSIDVRARVKTAAQMLAELEAIWRSGYRGHVDFVDDNFIGNKKAVKALLPELIAWQKEHD